MEQTVIIQKQCKECGTTETSQWYSGPICRKCYGKNRETEERRQARIIKGRNYYKSKKAALDNRICRHCNKEFTPSRKDVIFCCRKCGVDYWRSNNRYYCSQDGMRRYREDLNRRLSTNLRNRLKYAIKNNQKTGSAVNDLGCSIPELKLHLESKFQPGMSWENYGLYSWHIDHIIPLSSFDLTDRDQLLKACHFTNLQPLWAIENLSKGYKILQENIYGR